MKKYTLLFWITCISLITTLYAQENIKEKTYAGPKEALHVYLLIGQSNMAGRASYSKEEAGVIDRCYLFNENERWEPAKNPLNRYSTIRKGLHMQKMNPGYEFSATMLKKDKGISLGLVVNAKGGTKIAEWKKGSEFYNEALARLKEAQKTGTLKGVLWHQGEGNSKRPAGYLDELTILINELRKDIGIADLPFIAGGLYYHPEGKPHTKELNEQVSKLPSAVTFTGYVSSEGLTAQDNTHFDSAGMKLLGQRYAEEMLKIQAKPKLEPGFKPLFDGKTLNGWHAGKSKGWTEASDGVFSINKEEQAIHAYAKREPNSPQVTDCLISEKQFSHFILKMEYKWQGPRFAPRTDWDRDAGLLFHTHGDLKKVWPHSVEMQIGESLASKPRVPGQNLGSTKRFHTGDLFVLGKGVTAETNADKELWYNPNHPQRATKIALTPKGIENPLGEWNQMEIRVYGAKEAIFIFNGTEVLRVYNMAYKDEEEAQSQALSQGHIGLQAEYAEILYRNIRVKELKPGEKE